MHGRFINLIEKNNLKTISWRFKSKKVSNQHDIPDNTGLIQPLRCTCHKGSSRLGV
jgi:hypothetical protein